MRTIPLALCLVGALAAVAAQPAAQTRGWQARLATQLAEEEGCTLAFFSRISVVVQNGRDVILARAHCEDGRAFDAARIAPAERFDLRPCGAGGDPGEERTC